MKIDLIKIKCKVCNYKTQAAFTADTLPIRCLQCEYGNFNMILDEDKELEGVIDVTEIH